MNTFPNLMISPILWIHENNDKYLESLHTIDPHSPPFPHASCRVHTFTIHIAARIPVSWSGTPEVNSNSSPPPSRPPPLLPAVIASFPLFRFCVYVRTINLPWFFLSVIASNQRLRLQKRDSYVLHMYLLITEHHHSLPHPPQQLLIWQLFRNTRNTGAAQRSNSMSRKTFLILLTPPPLHISVP